MNATKTVLLVEDNDDDVELTLLCFKKNGLANPIAVVRDGAEALDYLFARGAYANRPESQDPVVVLLDLKLPKISGLDVLKEARKNPRTHLTPVVILTTSNEQRDLIEGYGLGANSYIRKPVDLDQFMEAVRQLGMYWLLLNEQPPKAS